MTVSGVSGSSSSASSSSSSSSSDASSAASSASTAYTTFLTLLTTELSNQSPLDPTDTTQFVSQLIGLAQVEQQLETNSELSTIKSSVSSIDTGSGLGYIGDTVSASGSTAPLQSGVASWDYTLGSAASSTSLMVTSSDGTVVYSASGDTTAGAHSFTWNGTSSSGVTEPDGAYTLSVTALDDNGQTVTTSTTINGKVTGVDSTSGTTELELGDYVSVSLSDVSSVAK